MGTPTQQTKGASRDMAAKKKKTHRKVDPKAASKLSSSRRRRPRATARSVQLPQPITTQDYADERQRLEAATRGKPPARPSLSPRQIEIIRSALHDALRFSVVLPQWLALQTRLARARLAMRGKPSPEHVKVFARKMGVVDTKGRRSETLIPEEAEYVVYRYWELTCTDRLITHVDDTTMWASGFRAQVEARPHPAQIRPDFDPIQHPRPVVTAPVSPVEAVMIIRGWFPWAFASPQGVRAFLERHRNRLREERKRLRRSRLPADRARLAALPPPDFPIPGRRTIELISLR